MSSQHRARRRAGAPLRVLRGLGFLLMVALMAVARALGGRLRIEEPERPNKITQVEKKR